jgi:TrmH family RNA methyltransferase
MEEDSALLSSAAAGLPLLPLELNVHVQSNQDLLISLILKSGSSGSPSQLRAGRTPNWCDANGKVLGVNVVMENLRVVLVAPRNPLNVGAVARAMSNFGALHLRVVAPYERAFREAKSAVGASALLQDAEEFQTLAEAIADCTLVVGTTAIGNREIKLPLRDLDKASPLVRKWVAASRVAILFGSEKWGLSNESMSHCHWLMHIPTRKEHYSMNLGQAVAVCLWELRRGGRTTTELGRGPQSSRREPAKVATVEMISEVMLETLHRSGYIPPRGRASAEEKLRRMLRRFALEEADAVVLLGMMRKILWKVEQGERAK